MKKDVKGDNLTSTYNILLCVIHNCTKVINVMTWMSQSNLDTKVIIILSFTLGSQIDLEADFLTFEFFNDHQKLC